MESGDWKDFLNATMSNDLDRVAYYLKLGADPNFFHPEIMTSALVEAARQSEVGIVGLLMSSGGNPKLNSPLGESALSVANVRKDKEVLRALSR